MREGGESGGEKSVWNLISAASRLAAGHKMAGGDLSEEGGRTERDAASRSDVTAIARRGKGHDVTWSWRGRAVAVAVAVAVAAAAAGWQWLVRERRGPPRFLRSKLFNLFLLVSDFIPLDQVRKGR